VSIGKDLVCGQYLSHKYKFSVAKKNYSSAASQHKKLCLLKLLYSLLKGGGFCWLFTLYS